MNTNFKTNQPSEGEQFLQEFFDSVGIVYEVEKKIEGLKNDSKQYRNADFYLPKYGVYVEFFGLWNHNGSEEYRLKKDVYWRNNVPCIYIYPENLGTIGFTFDKRIQAVLQKHKMNKELYSYRKYKLFETREFFNRVGIVALCVLILSLLLPDSLNSLGWRIVCVVTVVLIYQAYNLYELYMNIFKRNRHSLNYLQASPKLSF